MKFEYLIQNYSYNYKFKIAFKKIQNLNNVRNENYISKKARKSCNRRKKLFVRSWEISFSRDGR